MAPLFAPRHRLIAWAALTAFLAAPARALPCSGGAAPVRWVARCTARVAPPWLWLARCSASLVPRLRSGHRGRSASARAPRHPHSPALTLPSYPSLGDALRAGLEGKVEQEVAAGLEENAEGSGAGLEEEEIRSPVQIWQGELQRYLEEQHRARRTDIPVHDVMTHLWTVLPQLPSELEVLNEAAAVGWVEVPGADTPVLRKELWHARQLDLLPLDVREAWLRVVASLPQATFDALIYCLAVMDEEGRWPAEAELARGTGRGSSRQLGFGYYQRLRDALLSNPLVASYAAHLVPRPLSRRRKRSAMVLSLDNLGDVRRDLYARLRQFSLKPKAVREAIAFGFEPYRGQWLTRTQLAEIIGLAETSPTFYRYRGEIANEIDRLGIRILRAGSPRALIKSAPHRVRRVLRQTVEQMEGPITFEEIDRKAGMPRGTARAHQSQVEQLLLEAYKQGGNAWLQNGSLDYLRRWAAMILRELEGTFSLQELRDQLGISTRAFSGIRPYLPFLVQVENARRGQGKAPIQIARLSP